MTVDADSALRARCVSCGKWMLVRGGNPCCETCSAALKIVPRPEHAEAPDPYDQSQCGRCGAYIYADSPRCPECGEYNHEELEPAPRRLPRIYIIAAWLLLFTMLGPLAYALYRLLSRSF